MEISIRSVRLDDAKSIVNLSNQLGYPSSLVAIEKRLQNVLAHPDNQVLAAFKEEKMLGWIHYFWTPRVESDAFVEIGGLVVDETVRHQGVGKLLVQESIKWTRTGHCVSVRVRCNELRKSSHAFYEHLGFTLNKTQKVFNLSLDS